MPHPSARKEVAKQRSPEVASEHRSFSVHGSFRRARVCPGDAGRCAETGLGRDSRWPTTGECGVR